ncbi:hypothetical protein ACWEJP_28600 [Streptomyces sp. NPDC004749]
MEREALTESGSLRPGVHDAPAATSPVYHLSPLAIAAWLLGRYDTANSIMKAMAEFTDPETGGVYEFRSPRADPVQDTLKTAQLGMCHGATTAADATVPWSPLSRRRTRSAASSTSAARASPASSRESRPPFSPVTTSRRETSSPSGERWTTSTSPSAVVTSSSTTVLGADLQVRLGGAAVTYAAASQADLRPWVARMGEWFARRQKPDGSWAPATFVAPHPGPLDHYWKTAEHVMELSYIVASLSAQPVDAE